MLSNPTTNGGDHQNGKEKESVATTTNASAELVKEEDLDNTPWALRIRKKSHVPIDNGKATNQEASAGKVEIEIRSSKRRKSNVAEIKVEKHTRRKTTQSESSADEYIPEVSSKI